MNVICKVFDDDKSSKDAHRALTFGVSAICLDVTSGNLWDRIRTTPDFLRRCGCNSLIVKIWQPANRARMIWSGQQYVKRWQALPKCTLLTWCWPPQFDIDASCLSLPRYSIRHWVGSNACRSATEENKQCDKQCMLLALSPWSFKVHSFFKHMPKSDTLRLLYIWTSLPSLSILADQPYTSHHKGSMISHGKSTAIAGLTIRSIISKMNSIDFAKGKATT